MICTKCKQPSPFIPNDPVCPFCDGTSVLSADDLLFGDETRLYPTFREKQHDMALKIEAATAVHDLVVRDVPEQTTGLAVQAPVGVGKTLAYSAGIQNMQGVILISTATTNLQKQIYNTLHSVTQHAASLTGQPPANIFLWKGASHSACMLRAVDDPDSDMLHEAILRANSHIIDDVTNLSETLLERLKQFRTRRCAAPQCAFTSTCPYAQNKRRVSDAIKRSENSQTIIVTNHATIALMIKEEINGSSWGKQESSLLQVWREASAVIIDEAHEFQDYLDRVFEQTLTLKQLRNMVLLSSIPDPHKKDIENDVKSLAKALRESLGKTPSVSFASVAAAPYNELLLKPLANIAVHLERHPGVLREDPERGIETLQAINRDYGHTKILQTYADDIKLTAKSSVQADRVCKALRQKIIVFTSGTLFNSSTPGKELTRYTGITFDESNCVSIDTDFNYPSQSCLYVPNNKLLDPSGVHASPSKHNAWAQAIADEVTQLNQITSGFMFVLFSAKRDLYSVKRHLEKSVRGDILVQGMRGLSTQEVKDAYVHSAQEALKYRQDGPVLLGLNSFWHGVSIEGPLLTNVVVCKLRFPHPDDPALVVLKNKGLTFEQQFGLVSIPHCIQTVRQAEGRLIRTEHDYGVFSILDPRIHTKAYGPRILRCLLTSTTRTAKISKVQEYFQRSKAKYHVE